MLLEIFAGVLSGAISATITLKLISRLNMPENIQFVISAFVASLTIGGKALGKNVARKYATPILSVIGKILNKLRLGGK